MTVTKDVIRDLMPLYAAGEASADTRRLVEEFLRAHPGENFDGDPLHLPDVAPPGRLEMDSLDHTRKLYEQRSIALGAAFAVTYAVFSFRFNNDGLQFVLYRDLPAAAWILLAAGLPVWVLFLSLHRRWAQTGLSSQATFSKAVWMMGGVLAVIPYAFVISYRFGLDDVRGLSVVGAFIGLAVARALYGRGSESRRAD